MPPKHPAIPTRQPRTPGVSRWLRSAENRESVIQMSGFRSLGDDEEVEFECKASDKGVEATAVSGPEGGDCKGSHRRPMSKKRFRKIRDFKKLQAQPAHSSIKRQR
ncbi:hypothetical protein HPB52_016523 [Rhipicephalus sanguineus]|uniref:CSD domain-containing protein n=1 Tax=Rhipicephalus sanguineus TaxID=34632 RepID=A0A9D4PMG5_RHISA|nr:hypothetical protein HPB52_016523 [Rhipicephalus sanguineus]